MSDTIAIENAVRGLVDSSKRLQQHREAVEEMESRPMAERIRALPDWEGHKVGIACPCGGSLETITDDFSIEVQDRIGAKEIVRCVRCSQEFDADDNQRLRVQVTEAA
jgi:hypothetical protein